MGVLDAQKVLDPTLPEEVMDFTFFHIGLLSLGKVVRQGSLVVLDIVQEEGPVKSGISLAQELGIGGQYLIEFLSLVLVQVEAFLLII